MIEPQTLPQAFLEKVSRYGPEKVAFRQKEFGIWKEFNWQYSYEKVKCFALGLIALGVQRGDKICTVGDNDRQYLWAYLGLQAVGAAQVGLYTDAIPKEMQYVIAHSDATFALAKDQEQCDKLLEIKDQIPEVKRVVYWDTRGLWGYEDGWLISYEEVLTLGADLAEKEPDRFETEVALGTGDDLAILCYTSGTTGLPKGVMLTHSNMIESSNMYQKFDPRYDTDNHLSFLPLGWIAESVLGFGPHATRGVILNFPEEPETVRENIREIAPEGLFYPARLWDTVVATVQVRINDASWINRKLYQLFLPIGYKVADLEFAKKSIPLGLKIAYKLGDWLIFSPLRNQLGMSRIRAAYTAGAALSPDAMRFFHALGINLKQIYASTEVTATATAHKDGDIKFASVGVPLPDMEVRIAENDEIQVSGPTVMKGYFKNPEATTEDLIVENGKTWFRTGDAGYIDSDGHLIYLDRVKDMITLANGERFSPQFIEGRLKFNPYIRDVMAIGSETRDYVTALIIIDFENVGRWAEKQGIGFTTFVDLSQKPEVCALVQEAVKELNENLPEAGRVRHFILMHKEFDADEAEMTRTRKLRRGFLYDRYDNIIEAMYNGQDKIKVHAAVQYQDGREGVIETEVNIMSA